MPYIYKFGKTSSFYCLYANVSEKKKLDKSYDKQVQK